MTTIRPQIHTLLGHDAEAPAGVDWVDPSSPAWRCRTESADPRCAVCHRLIAPVYRWADDEAPRWMHARELCWGQQPEGTHTPGFTLLSDGSLRLHYPGPNGVAVCGHAPLARRLRLGDVWEDECKHCLAVVTKREAAHFEARFQAWLDARARLSHCDDATDRRRTESQSGATGSGIASAVGGRGHC